MTPSRLAAGVQIKVARRQHDRLQENSVVEPATPLQVTIDGKDQPDRRAEKFEVAPGCDPARLPVALGDVEEPIELPSDLAAPALVGFGERFRVVVVFAER